MQINSLFNYGVVIILFTGLLAISCSREDSRIEEERVKLEQYLQEQGYTGIEPTSSGLYHVVIEDGTGEIPSRSDFVNIEFVAKLVDGTVFETSDEDVASQHNILRADKLYGPAKFNLEQLGIQGLREGIMLMKEGGSSRLIIPSNLAFGSADLGIIPPYSTLIYDVDLLDVIADPAEHEKNLLEQFIEDNDIDVSPTQSGLYYIEKEPGEGNLPGDNKSVTINFKGYLLDGRLFDKSSAANPVVLNTSATDIIPGFIEGIRLMRKGGKARFIIPWNIGYGAGGSLDGIIPPYSTLIFDVELIEIG
ncbi:MAG: hypothetical protein EA408_07340 [Marinilabiliales bacterium]|nr:MAG: hypothetical protein EA408_07340 [Marinilabiliales bacterium]